MSCEQLEAEYEHMERDRQKAIRCLRSQISEFCCNCPDAVRVTEGYEYWGSKQRLVVLDCEPEDYEYCPRAEEYAELKEALATLLCEEV
jgi:hypothetical protein